jgi:ABC-type Na+ transport system ATPase subunit NatA
MRQNRHCLMPANLHKNIHIGAFRNLVDFRLVDCGSVNILVGGNNSGKTSVLEALLLLSDPLRSSQWIDATQLRRTWPLVDTMERQYRSPRLGAISWLFPRRESVLQPIRLESTGFGPIESFSATLKTLVGEPPRTSVFNESQFIEGFARYDSSLGPESGVELNFEYVGDYFHPTLFDSEPRTFQLVLWEKGRETSRPGSQPVVRVVFATPISHRSDGYLASRVSRLIHAKRKDQALELLRGLDANVTDLIIVAPERPEEDSIASPRMGDIPELHVEYAGTGLVPIHSLGDGIRRAVHFAALISELQDGGILLIDEVEVGMHTSVLMKVFSWLSAACRAAKIQLFVTTHSLEAIDALIGSAPDNDIVLYRLNKKTVKRLQGKQLRSAREEFGQEIR